VLDPIPTTGLTAADVDDLAQRTRDLMLKELVALTAEAQGKPMAVESHSNTNGSAKASGADLKIPA
jgi:lysophosphatidate acyltransferase